MKLKDPFSGLSHGIGALLGVAALVLLLVWSRGEPWRATAFSIYGATLILLFTGISLSQPARLGEG